VRVLVVEDERRLAVALGRWLTRDGFAVDLAYDGDDGLWRARHGSYDAMVLDILLPGLSGYEVVRRLRRAEIWLPVLMLTAKDGEYDIADALDLGADDYLVKPFSLVVLLARLRALLRRGATERPPLLHAAGLTLAPASSPSWSTSSAIAAARSARRNCSTMSGTNTSMAIPTSLRSTSATFAGRSIRRFRRGRS
jgi:DNA-binding response OmpR family regulator